MAKPLRIRSHRSAGRARSSRLLLSISGSAVPGCVSVMDLVPGGSKLISTTDARPGSLGPAEKAISPDMSDRLRIRAPIDVRVLLG